MTWLIVAFAARESFLPDIAPIASTEGDQPIWMFEAAFLLRATENIAAILFGLALAALAVDRWNNWSR